jgi:ABC-2 type transport system permease protein
MNGQIPIPELDPNAPAPLANGAVPTYSVGRTLPLRTELRRQLLRRRTQLALGFLAILPIILWAAFSIGGNDRGSQRSLQLVDLAKDSGLNFVSYALFASSSFLLVVIVALFFGDTIASEASWSSLKYLLAIPIPRGRLLARKATIAGVLSGAGLIVLPAVALILGSIAYGADSMVSPTGEALAYPTGVARLVLAVGYIAVSLLWVAGFSLFLSVSTDAPLGAVGGAVMVSILSQILDSITALGGLRNYLPTHYNTAWADFFSQDIDWNNAIRGMLSAIVYGTIFFALASRKFARRDITS